MIPFDSWTFSEFMLDDIGVMTAWTLRELEEDARAQVDYLFMRYLWIENQDLFMEGEFRSLGKIADIPLRAGGTNYRLLGSCLLAHEFVILVVCKEPRDGQLDPDMRTLAEQRLNEVRSNLEKRREYRFD
jgi:hypothetical protein